MSLHQQFPPLTDLLIVSVLGLWFWLAAKMLRVRVMRAKICLHAGIPPLSNIKSQATHQNQSWPQTKELAKGFAPCLSLGLAWKKDFEFLWMLGTTSWIDCFSFGQDKIRWLWQEFPQWRSWWLMGGEGRIFLSQKVTSFLKNEANIGFFCTHCNVVQRRNSTHIQPKVYWIQVVRVAI